MTDQRFDYERIRQDLSQLSPFTLVDRVLALQPWEAITTLRCVSSSEPWVPVHFAPGRGPAIMPGILLVEMVAQSAQLVGTLSESSEGSCSPFERISTSTGGHLLGEIRARFYKPVVPGDVCRAEVKILGAHDGGVQYEGNVTVDGERVAYVRNIAVVPKGA